MTRALIVCPGRGSYGRHSLGSLQGRGAAAQRVIDACDAHRSALGRPTVSELDAADSFRGSRHVAGEHASLLTFACAMADLAELDTSAFEVVGVTGNSMGWYIALAASGALSLDHAIELVETMAGYQAGNVIGGQVMYPIAGADWQRSPELVGSVERALAQARQAGRSADWSIRLGSHAVLGADRDGVRFLMEHLPELQVGSRSFPVQLPLHSAFHTALLQPTAARAASELAHLDFVAPRVPLIDGLGTIYRPLWAHPRALAAYTTGDQVHRTYDLDLAVRTAMHSCGPDVVIALGPGNALGGPVARIQVQDNWRGLGSREAFIAAQADSPTLLSFGVPEQRERLVR